MKLLYVSKCLLKKVSDWHVKLGGCVLKIKAHPLVLKDALVNLSEKQIKGRFLGIHTLPKRNAEVSLRFVKNDRNIIKRNGEVAERPKALPC